MKNTTDNIGDTIWFGAIVLTIGSVIRLGASIYLPSLPVIGAELHISDAMMSQTLSIYLIVFALCILVAGPLSDAFGRKIILRSGLLFFVIGSMLCASANSYGALLGGRVIQAFGASMIPGTLLAMIRDVASDTRMLTLTGFLAALGGLFLVGAPLLGGIMTDLFGWHSNFWLLSGFAGLALIVALLWLPETLPQNARLPLSIKSILTRCWNILRSADFTLVILPVIMLFVIQGSFLVAAPYIMMKKYGLTSTEFGLSNIVIVIGIFAGRSAGAHLLKKHPPAMVYLSGGYIAAIMMLIFAAMSTGIVDGITIFLIAIGLFALLYGLISPIGMKSTITAFRAASGITASLQGAALLGASAVGGMLTGLIAGHFPNLGMYASFTIISALLCLTAAITAITARHRLQ
jgi:DHA1 family bicyclomycin/chloramphenicol resistance-like MFS transporter